MEIIAATHKQKRQRETVIVYVVLGHHPESDAHWVVDVFEKRHDADAEVRNQLANRNEGHVDYEVVDKELVRAN